MLALDCTIQFYVLGIRNMQVVSQCPREHQQDHQNKSISLWKSAIRHKPTSSHQECDLRVNTLLSHLPGLGCRVVQSQSAQILPFRWSQPWSGTSGVHHILPPANRLSAQTKPSQNIFCRGVASPALAIFLYRAVSIAPHCKLKQT